MKIRDIVVETEENQQEEQVEKREQFWEQRCKDEPGYQGCRVYDL
jgi:siroheme synthase (precorrin-2 oxidase/ferrochelatase)